MVPRWWLAIVGIVGILAGVVAFVQPTAVAQVFLILIAVWAIIVRLVTIWGAIQLRKEIAGEWLLVLSGVLSVGFGGLLFTQPAGSAVGLVWLIGAFAILFGINNIALAFKVKGLGAV